MADATATTRRSLFAGALGLAGLAALPAMAAPAAPRVSDADFIQSLTFIHRNGRKAALSALAGGMKPEWLFSVIMTDKSPCWPALLFKNEQGQRFTFRPAGMDH